MSNLPPRAALEVLREFKAESCPLHPAIPLRVQSDIHGHAEVFCPSCRFAYDPIHLLAVLLQVPVEEATDTLNQRFKVGARPPGVPEFLTHRRTVLPGKLPPIDFSDQSYWEGRGLSGQVLSVFGAGVAGGLPALPLYSPQNEWCGVVQRDPQFAPNQHVESYGKYLFHGRVQSEVFGLHQARMFNQDYRVLVEGVVDAMRGWEASLPAVGFIRNSSSQCQMEILLKETRKVIYCMDGDEHGEFFKRSTAHRMFVVPFFSWGAVTLPSGKDPGALPPQQLQDLVGAVHESLW